MEDTNQGLRESCHISVPPPDSLCPKQWSFIPTVQWGVRVRGVTGRGNSESVPPVGFDYEVGMGAAATLAVIQPGVLGLTAP